MLRTYVRTYMYVCVCARMYIYICLYKPHSKRLTSTCGRISPNSIQFHTLMAPGWPSGTRCQAFFGPLYETPPEADGKEPKQLPGRALWQGDIHHSESYYFKAEKGVPRCWCYSHQLQFWENTEKPRKTYPSPWSGAQETWRNYGQSRPSCWGSRSPAQPSLGSVLTKKLGEMTQGEENGNVTIDVYRTILRLNYPQFD